MTIPLTPGPALALSRVPGQASDLVIGLLKPHERPTLVGLSADLEATMSARLGGSLMSVALAMGAQSTPGHAVVVPVGDLRLVIVGLGEDVDLTAEQLRVAAGTGVRTAADLEDLGAHRVAVSLDPGDKALVQAVAEGALLGAYKYRSISATPAEERVKSIAVVVAQDVPGAAAALERGRVIAECVCTARDWVNTPPNLLYPETFADAAKNLVRDLSVTVEILDDKALDKQGYGGILAVGGGSERKPRLVRLDYRPRGAKQHLVLVGKGITFDSGGLNLKTAEGMKTMKCDMGGAAAVLAATRAIAALGLKVRVTAYAPLAENMASGTAFRPGDVITMYGGRTVENTNSDAEGRIVMADALARSNKDGADLVVDIATLTGACRVALGTRIAGLMASDDQTADVLLDAAEASGELFWQLPITDHLRKTLDSKVADTVSTSTRMGGAMVAAAFLQSFLDPSTRWAHLDIAGPAFNDEKPYEYVPAGGTGMGVRTLIALAESMAN